MSAQADAMPGPRNGQPDPELRRLRALLNLQRQAADTGAWAAFHALAASIRDELERQRGQTKDPAAAADVAHLQLRLDLLLRDRLAELATRQQGLRARRAYTAYAQG